MNITSKRTIKNSGEVVSSSPDLLPGSPYDLGKQIHDDRYGFTVEQTKNWRYAAFLSIGCIIALVIAIVVMSHQRKEVVHIIEVDKLGQTLSVGTSDQNAIAPDHVVLHDIAEWIKNSRSVFGDGGALKDHLNSTYQYASGNAVSYLNDYYKSGGRDPFTQRKAGTVNVIISTVQKQLNSTDTYTVRWTEMRRDVTGQQVGSPQHWIATLTIAIDPPTTEADVIKNGLGVFITSVQWSQENY